MPFQEKNPDIIKWLENTYLESAKSGKPLGSKKLAQLCKQKFGNDAYSRGDIARKINTQFRPKLTLKLANPPTKKKPAKPPQNSLVPISGTKENAHSGKKIAKKGGKPEKSSQNEPDESDGKPQDDPLQWLRDDRKNIQIIIKNATLMIGALMMGKDVLEEKDHDGNVIKSIPITQTNYELNMNIDQCWKRLKIYDDMYGLEKMIQDEQRKTDKPTDPFDDIDLDTVYKELEGLE